MRSANLPEDTIGVVEAAKLLKVHVSCIYRWLHGKRIAAWRVGGRWWLSRAEVLAVPQRVGPGEVLASPAQRPTLTHAQAVALLREKGYMV